MGSLRSVLKTPGMSSGGHEGGLGATGERPGRLLGFSRKSWEACTAPKGWLGDLLGSVLMLMGALLSSRCKSEMYLNYGVKNV